MGLWKKSKQADADTCSTTSSILVHPGTSSGHKSSKRSKRKAKRRHSVDFAGATDVVEIESADEDCKGDMWYSKEEFNLMRERNTLVVRMMKRGTFQESDQESVRGLEHKLRVGHKEREDNKFDALNAVLFEQEKQYARGTIDTARIAEKYERAAGNAKDSAVSMALLDANECNAPLFVVADGDQDSVLSDIGSVLDESDDWYEKKMKLQSVFQGLSVSNKDKSRRRASV